MTVAIAAVSGGVSLDAQVRPIVVRFSVDSGVESADKDAAAAPSLDGTRVQAELSHQRHGRRGALTLWGGATKEQFWQSRAPGSIAVAARIDGELTVTRRTHLAFTDRINWAPLDLFSSVSSSEATTVSPTVRSGAEIVAARSLSHSGQLELTRMVGPRTQLVVTAMQSDTADDRDRVVTSGVSGRFQQQVHRFSHWYGAYGVVFSSGSRTAGGSAADPYAGAGQRQNLDLGFGYGRPLPMWPHTTIAVRAGGSMFSEARGQRVRVDAEARVDHQVSGHWSLNAAYSRPTEYVPGVVLPLVSDTLRMGADGMLPRGIALSIAAHAESGTVGVVGASRFESYVATVHASRPLGPRLHVDVEYHDSAYRFAVAPGAGIPAVFARRGLRTALVWDVTR